MILIKMEEICFYETIFNNNKLIKFNNENELFEFLLSKINIFSDEKNDNLISSKLFGNKYEFYSIEYIKDNEKIKTLSGRIIDFILTFNNEYYFTFNIKIALQT